MWDDIIYVGLLLVSIAFGKVTRQVQDKESRKWTSSIFGLIVVLVVSGWSTLHTLSSVILHTILIKFSPKSLVHWINFVFGFAYLIFFRSCGSIEILSWFPMPPSHTNAVQMIMTLKLMGLAFEVHDSWKSNASGDSNNLDQKYQNIDVNPRPLDIFHYAFAHTGVLTGPYYRFRTFQDLYETPYAQYAECDLAMIKRIIRAPIYIILFLITGYIFPLKAVLEEDYYETTSIWYRLFYMTPVFFNFRMRLYTGFLLSECSCIMAGLGAYPVKSEPKPGQGPSKLEKLTKVTAKDEMNFEAIHNIDEFAVETVCTMREALKFWNMTVQWWLVSNVYRRFPKVSRDLRALIVMMVSSIWHGIYSGYYLSLGSVPFVLAVEDLYEKIVRRKLDEKQKETYDTVSWFMRFQWFSYLGMGFQLLKVDTTLTFWHSIYYLGHTILPIFYLAGLFIVKPITNMMLPSRPNND